MTCPVCKTDEPFDAYEDEDMSIMLICSACRVCLWPEELAEANTCHDRRGI